MGLPHRAIVGALGVASTLLLVLALLQIGIACAALDDPELKPSTCSAMKWFGARIPFCGISVGFKPLTDQLTFVLNAVNPLYLWVSVAGGSTLLLWLAYFLWSEMNALSPTEAIRQRQAPKATAELLGLDQ